MEMNKLAKIAIAFTESIKDLSPTERQTVQRLAGAIVAILLNDPSVKEAYATGMVNALVLTSALATATKMLVEMKDDAARKRQMPPDGK
jgi:hypothetical protein